MSASIALRWIEICPIEFFFLRICLAREECLSCILFTAVAAIFATGRIIRTFRSTRGTASFS